MKMHYLCISKKMNYFQIIYVSHNKIKSLKKCRQPIYKTFSAIKTKKNLLSKELISGIN